MGTPDVPKPDFRIRGSDLQHMRHALRLAARALGRVAPNPAVGCVVVKDGHVAGRGWTQPGGRPHAETVALAAAGAQAKGSSLYVTLEPCAHRGQTPPCTDALIAAGIARVVGAMTDPDPRVNGAGYAALRHAGIAVASGACESEARALNAGFISRVTKGRPLVALKIAQSADGFVADATGHSKWITGERARAHGHLLRARHEAILVGIGTVLADDPELTCRLPGLASRSPLRVVLDSGLHIPESAKLVRNARSTPTIVFTVAEGGAHLAAHGVEIERVAPDADGRPDIGAVLERLAGRGITRLLVEGGPKVHAAFLDRGLADALHIYRAPILIGAGGLSAVGALRRGLEQAPRFALGERVALGPDVLESYAATV
jgi:diaminohydroxyphosphoribosylaminopyrimidine deaminase/5-amino-6-(5-phosphoribosylamino)uracil reductase